MISCYSAVDQVLKFLSDQNRPFTINDIVQGLNQQLGKSQVTTTLNKLVEQNRVIEKNCGKQKIYCVAQKSTLPLKNLNSDALELERGCSSLSLKLKDVEDNLERKKTQLKKIERTLTQEEVLQKKKILEEEIGEIQGKMEGLQGKTYDKKEGERIENEYRSVLKEYNRRKRMCMEMVDAIFENYPKSKKSLLQEIGIETDDDVGFTVKIK